MLFGLFCLCSSLQAALSPVQHKAMNWVDQTPATAIQSIDQLGTYLAAVSADEYTQALTVFTWVAKNRRYDWESYKEWNLGLPMAPQGAESVLARKRGVCAGYAALMEALCEAVHLKCATVSGFAKGYGFQPGEQQKQTNHAWNAIQIYGKWQLMDATWASPDSGKTGINYEYFCASPRQLLDTHFPAEAKWQMVTQPMDRATFFDRPLVWNPFHTMAFESYLPCTQSLVSNPQSQSIFLEKAFANELHFQLYFTDPQGAQTPLAFTLKTNDTGAWLTFQLHSHQSGQLTVFARGESFSFFPILTYYVVGAKSA
jgi:Transglutaminase-like superfamily